MMRRGPGTHEHKCDEHSAAATKYHRKENCQNCAASVGLVSACQPDAITHKRPDHGYQSTAKRYHLQRASGTLRKSQDPQSGFKRLVSAANDPQTEMHDAAADKKPDHQEQWWKDDHCHRADAHAGHDGQTVIFVREQTNRLKPEREQKRHDASYASTDQRVDERLAEAAFALHHTERFGWTGKHH